MSDSNSNGASPFKRPEAIIQHRPFTLHEALPYSPHTSVVPFAYDLIPEPASGSGHLTSSVAELFIHNEFDKLNQDGLAADPAIQKNVKKVADFLLHDLKSSIKTTYKFKTVSRVPGASGPDILPSQTLSPLSRSIFDKVSSLFDYQGNDQRSSIQLTIQGNGHPGRSASNACAPQPPPPKSPVSSRAIIPPFTPKRPSTSTNFDHEEAVTEAQEQSRRRIASVTTPQATRKNDNFEVAIPLKRPVDASEYVEIPEEDGPVAVKQEHIDQDSREDTLNTGNPPEMLHDAQESLDAIMMDVDGGKIGLAIDLQPSLNFNKSEYVKMADTFDAPINLSTKRKNDVVVKDLTRDTLDQRQRADVALTEFERFINDTFNAVSSAITGVSGSENVAILNNNQDPVLTTPTHQTANTLLVKMITLGSFGDADLDALLKLQKLSETSIKCAADLPLKVEESWNDADFQGWIPNIAAVENALRAARTGLRIMSGGREDKQLYSETVIQNSIDLFKSIMDGIIIPVVEMRNSGPSSALFKLVSSNRKALTPIFTNTQRLFELLASLVGSIEFSDTVINTLEFTASKLIFVENAHYEKDSAIGVQRFDGLRLVAMNMLCQIFILKPEQRQGILTDILTSLEKLPVGKQSARHFKLVDGANIQPVSALIMRLIQSSSGKVKDIKASKNQALAQETTQEATQDEVTQGEASEQKDDTYAPGLRKVMATIRTEEDGAAQPDIAIKELDNTLNTLFEATKNNANFVVNFIVSRALSATKSGDTPYRNLLDLFVEDFTTCLDSPDWPAAELLLRMIMFRMVKLSEAERAPAPAKNMALDVLGTMGASISRLRSQVRKISCSMEGTESDDLSRFLADLAFSSLDQHCRVEDMVSWAGPYRTTLEFLEGRQVNDPYLRGALSFLVCDWAFMICTGYRSFTDKDVERDVEFGTLAYRLRMMIDDERWLTNEYSFKTVTAAHAKLAFYTLLLRSPLCESFPTILNIVLGSMASDQATVRSKSLKSVNQILETDPAILDGDSVVIHLILKCAGDSSPQVRDSAVGLIGKCISMRPLLEDEMTPRVIERFTDSGVGVRKRSMKLARDIYLRNNNKAIRGPIAAGLLLRVQDPDEGVRDLAKQMMEEVWFAPFYNAEDSAEYQTSLTDHVSLMIRIVKSGNVAGVLDKVLQSILNTKESKPAEGPFTVCTKLVANMFGLIDNLDSDDPTVPAGRDALLVLMIFAKADPKLFTFEQVRLLKPHLSAIQTREDLLVFRAVTAIYRRVLPNLSRIHSHFLQEVRSLLNQSVSKLQKPLLDNTMACIWIISDILQNIAPLSRLAASCMAGAQAQKNKSLDAKTVSTFSRYAILMGMIGKHCNLESEIDFFRDKFPSWKGKTVTSLMVDILLPFALKGQPMSMRSSALDSIGLICESSPRNYVSPNVYTCFQAVFDDKISQLENMILSSFKEFLLTEERRSEAASAEAAAEKAAGKKRELTVMGGTNFDDVASATTQRFLKDITRISLSAQDDHAFLAMEVLGSINRQGLVHPKETGITLITLETSDLHKISETAFQEHKVLHQKHETVLEREYAKAIQSAYQYQCNVCDDSRGARTGPYQAKLHLLMEVMKVSKSKNRQKLLEKICSQADFDLNKLNVSGHVPNHVLFARFIVENLSYMEYVTLGEVIATVNIMEKIVITTGAPIAQTIESDIFDMRMDAIFAKERTSAPAATASTSTAPKHDLMEMALDGKLTVDGTVNEEKEPTPAPAPIELDIDPQKLKRFSAASAILVALWDARTYLRRLYGLGLNRRETKVKALAKDLSKAPIKVQGITGDKLWEELSKIPSAFDTQQSQLRKLKAFVDLMNVDSEFKVPNEDEEMGEGMGPSTPLGDEDQDDMDDHDDPTSFMPTETRGRKRKGAGTPGGGARKKQARASSKPRPRGRPRKNPLPEPEPEPTEVSSEWI
ncbi:Protein rad9 [Ceratocystis lukuohia]|uniref:Sister chromatid cohesion protein n=1 Tax=Ceratocystis lukuohia TaxID=2019550 RepID=A0ABR4MQ18_9PEZI